MVTSSRHLLITGADGQLARALRSECQKRGTAATALDRSTLDIRHLALVRRCVADLKPDAIINCAAYNAVDRAESQFAEACLVNGIGPRNLAIAAQEQGVPLVHFSTDYVFDGAKDTPYTIADQPRPLNRYGHSKRLGEQLVCFLTTRFYLVRLSWVFGHGKENLVTRVLRQAQQGQTLRYVTDQVSCPTYASDLAPAVLDLLETGAYGLYHVTSGTFCSRLEWVRTIVAMAGLPVPVEAVDSSAFPDAAPRPRFSAMDPFPLKETIGREIPDWIDATRRFLKEIGAGGG
ncbi:MAG: dTDP-4-dehydrorhamnose reductase [Bradymonadales bacterium]|nr:dTDP-4-dehydrorhamnose reductase [Bradymonadales bacterium]